MTETEVSSGNCGFMTQIKADSSNDREILITLTSECEMVASMQEDVALLNKMEAFVGFLNNKVYKSAARRLKHVSCPVPCGILKTLEVEAGFCLPMSATIRFKDK